MVDHRFAYADEELPAYQKRRRPERCSQFGPARRAVMRARSRFTSTCSHLANSTGGGFHRRLIKKPFHGMG